MFFYFNFINIAKIIPFKKKKFNHFNPLKSSFEKIYFFVVFFISIKSFLSVDAFENFFFGNGLNRLKRFTVQNDFVIKISILMKRFLILNAFKHLNDLKIFILMFFLKKLSKI